MFNFMNVVNAICISANDSKNLNERIELTNEDKEYFENMGVDPKNVILLAK